MVNVSIVVPVYNSEDIINELVVKLFDVMLSAHLTFEIILVNDFSTDNTKLIIDTLSENDKRIVSLHLKENVGQFKATLLGMKISRGKYIINMDDDMEHPPKECLKLIRCLDENPDILVVFGMSKNKYSIKRDLWIPQLRNQLANILWGKYPTDSFRIIRREVVFQKEQFLPKITLLEAYLKHYVDYKYVKYIDVEHHSRLKGKSNYNILKKIMLFCKMTPYFWFK